MYEYTRSAKFPVCLSYMKFDSNEENNPEKILKYNGAKFGNCVYYR